MAQSDIFIVFENENPVQFGYFEIDKNGEVRYLSSPYLSHPGKFEWKETLWSDSKPIIALNSNKLFIAYLKKDNKVFQIPLNESLGTRNILQVQQLRYLNELAFWMPLRQNAKAFILENTGEPVETLIKKYPSHKSIVNFPKMMVKETPFSAQNLFERLQVQKCDLVEAPQANQLENGHMEIWFDNYKLKYRVRILGQEMIGNFHRELDKDILMNMENGKFEENFSQLRLRLSRCYLNLDSKAQQIILASIMNNWPLLDVDDTQQEVIDEICRALIQEDDLNTTLVHSPELQDSVRDFRLYLLISKIHELYGAQKHSEMRVGDVQYFLRFLLAAASKQALRISPVDQSINILCNKKNQESSHEVLFYSCLNRDNPMFSKLFLKYLAYGLEKFSMEEVIAFQEQMKDFFVLIENHPHIFNEICENLAKHFPNEKISHVAEFITDMVKGLKKSCFEHQKKLFYQEFNKLVQFGSLVDVENNLQTFILSSLNQSDKLVYLMRMLDSFDEEKLVSSALVNQLFKECMTDIPIFLMAINRVKPSFYPMFYKHMQNMELKLSIEEYIQFLNGINEPNASPFLDVFGEDLLNLIENEHEFKTFLDSIKMNIVLTLNNKYPLRLSRIFSKSPSLWILFCNKDDSGELLESMLPYFKEHQINFYSLFHELNDALRKTLINLDFEQLLLDSPSLESRIFLLPYMSHTQIQQAFCEYDIDDLNCIAKKDINDKSFYRILDGQFSRISNEVNAQNLFEFLKKIDKRILNYIIKYQSPWLIQDIQTASQLTEMMNHLNRALFIKINKQKIEQYFPTHQDFLILISHAPNDKIRDGLIKHLKPSFQYKSYQDCIKELEEYDKTLNARKHSFFTIQSTNKNKISHVKALLAFLRGESLDLSSLSLANLHTLETIYQKYQQTVFDGQSFETLLLPQNQKMSTPYPRQ